LVIWWRVISLFGHLKWISGSRFAWYPILEVDHPRSQSWSLLWWNCSIPCIVYTTRNLWWNMVKHNHSMNLYNHIKQLKMCVSIINNYIHEAVANRYAQLRGGYLVSFLPFRNWGSRPQRVDRSSDQEHRTGQEPAKRWTHRLETGIEQTIGRENTRCEFSGGKVFDVFVTGWNLRFLRLDEFFVWRSKTIYVSKIVLGQLATQVFFFRKTWFLNGGPFVLHSSIYTVHDVPNLG